MLTRLLRLTDKLINALLRLLSGSLQQAAYQLYLWRVSVVGIVMLLASIASTSCGAGAPSMPRPLSAAAP